MAKKELGDQDLTNRKLDDIIRLLQDLVILEASRSGIKVDAIRQHLGVRKTRVTDLTKHVE